MEPFAHTIPEAVRLTRICRATIYELLRQGKIHGVKAGKRTLVLNDSLKAYMASLPPYKPSR